jgi:hypothetical protein
MYIRYSGHKEERRVSVVQLRPLTNAKKEIVIRLGEGEEIIFDNDRLFDTDTLNVINEELDSKYLVFNIIRILKTRVVSGNRYFDVVTDRGAVSFILKNPYNNIHKIKNDGLLIKDSVGNRFCIVSLNKLDKDSRKQLKTILIE